MIILQFSKNYFGAIMCLPGPPPRGCSAPKTKISPSQTAHNSAKSDKFFPLRQFQDIGSMTFYPFLGERQKIREK